MGSQRGRGWAYIGTVAVLAVLASWGFAGALASAPAAGPAAPAVDATAVAPAICNGGCGGSSAATMQISVAVTGVPQHYYPASQGQCLTAPHFYEDGCQVFVPMNIAFSQTSGVDSDIQDIAVEPSNNLTVFDETEGGTGFTASYNVNECSLTAPDNGCFDTPIPTQVNQYDVHGTDTSPYVWIIGEFGPTTAFVPGCSGEPYGMIYGPNGAPYNDSTEVELTYDCPQADGSPPGDGGNDSGSDWNYTQGGFDPCPANGSNDVDCWNGTFGELDFTDDAAVASSGCLGCHNLMADTVPILNRDNDSLPLFLWNGTYHWSISFVNRGTLQSSGTLDVVRDGMETDLTGALLPWHALTFVEEGLPAGTSWTVGVGGATATTTNGSVTFSATNGTVPFLALGPPRYVASVAGTSGPGFVGNVTVSGNTTLTLVFAKGAATGVAKFHEKGSQDGAWCVGYTLGGPPNGTDGAPRALLTSEGRALIKTTNNWMGGTASVCSSKPTITITGVPKSFSTGTTGGRPTPLAGAGGTPVYLGYRIAVKNPPGPYNYIASNAAGALNMTTAAGPVKTVFSLPTHTVVVTISGLPSPKTTWRVAVPTPTVCQTGASKCKRVIGMTSSGGNHGDPVTSLALTNGSYPLRLKPIPGYALSVGAPGLTANASNSTVELVVPGANVSLQLFLTPVPYAVTFTETGLPPGTNWSVDTWVHGDTSTNDDWSCSGCASIVATLPNGSYNYQVPAVAGAVGPAGVGAFHVHGAAVTVTVPFKAAPTAGAPTFAGLAAVGLLAAVPTGALARPPARRPREPAA